MENLNHMGLIIKEKRKSLDLTQLELAQRLGVSDKAVSKWERCESLPDITLVPKIAQQLGVSIEYLMTGKEPEEKEYTAERQAKADAEKENAQTLSHSARVMHSKINTRYTICICILFFVLLSGLFVIVPFVQYMPWNFHDILCAAFSIALFSVFYMLCRTNTVMLEGLGAKYAGGLGTVTALMTAGNVLILMFLGVQKNGYVSLVAYTMGLTAIKEEDNILYGSTGYCWLFLLLLLFAVVAANLYFSKDKNCFDKNVVAVFAGGGVMCAAHRLFFEFIENYIVSQKQFLYTFYLKRQPAMAIIGNIERYTLIYLAVMVVFGVALGIAFSKGRKQKLVTALVMAALAVYLGFCAGRFLSFEAYGNYYAKLTAYGTKDAVVITAALPHVLMILNGLIKEK